VFVLDPTSTTAFATPGESLHTKEHGRWQKSVNPEFLLYQVREEREPIV
jgi:hypothetical protein